MKREMKEIMKKVCSLADFFGDGYEHDNVFHIRPEGLYVNALDGNSFFFERDIFEPEELDLFWKKEGGKGMLDTLLRALCSRAISLASEYEEGYPSYIATYATHTAACANFAAGYTEEGNLPTTIRESISNGFAGVVVARTALTLILMIQEYEGCVNFDFGPEITGHRS